MFGHPGTEEEKNVTKEVYDRYLSVKRLIRKNSANVSPWIVWDQSYKTFYDPNSLMFAIS
jgi:hypothetical protein